MEEKKPLESRNLTHTSKEPEAQLWAKIGTASYSTPTKPASSNSAPSVSATTNSFENKPAEASNEPVAEPAPAKEEEGNALELHVDASAEPIQREGSEVESASANNNTASLEERRKKNKLDDGFEGGDEEEEETKKKEDEPERERTKGRGRSRSRDRDRSRSRERRRDRSRSRSISRGIEGSEGRMRPIRESTNSTDPKKIKSRVFVGHLSMPECTSEVLRETFSKFGKVNGINLQNGYGFVQFDCEESALLAIKGLNKTDLFGQEIVVDKPVAWINLDKYEARSELRSQRSQRALMEELEYLRQKDAERSRYPMGYGPDRSYERSYDRYDRPEYNRYSHYDMVDRDRGDRYSSYGGQPRNYRDNLEQEDRYSYREDPYDRRGGKGGGYYGQGDSYYGGRRM